MTARAPRAGPGLRLRIRMALGLAAIAGLTAATLAIVCLFLVERTFERELALRLDALAAAAAREVEARGRDLDARLGALEESLRGAESALLEKLLTGRTDPDVLQAAGRMQRSSGLDVLEIVDPAGAILSSGHWPEQAGHGDPAVDDLPRDRAVVRSVVRRADEVAAITRTRDLAVGTRELRLHGGFAMDARFLDALAGGEAALLVGAPGDRPVAGGRGGEIDGAAAARALGGSTSAGSTASAVRAPGVTGGSWEARAVPLSVAGGPGPGLVVAVDREAAEALIRRLRASFAGLGAVAVLGAALAGLAIAGRITRPIAELVRSVDAIARGEADYTFPRQPEHELDELVASFSRLHRSLAAQQHRTLAAERVAAWREVARRVAHEIKNPLAPIRLTVENLVKARGRAPQEFDRLFDEGARTILEEVEQLRRMVSEFSEFARLPEPRLEETDLDRLVDSVVTLYGSEPGITVRRTGGGLPPCRIDAGLVGQALKNVAQNAVDSMRERGGELAVRTALRPDGMVEVRLCDDGPGFTPEALRRASEPYFTTRQGGTGLGMAIARRVVVEHGGALEIANRPGGGATVTLRLPADGSPAPAAVGRGEVA